jgi:hypothetical protein
MNRKPFLKSLSEGRGNCPLPSRTHPQKQTRVVYTEELTHLGRTLVNLNNCLPLRISDHSPITVDLPFAEPTRLASRGEGRP